MDSANLADLAAFVAAADAGSFAAAARSRSVTRSGIAKSVARLEDRLGVRLFNRTTRSLGLTDDGRLFHERCLQILGDLEDAERSLTRGGGEPQGLLRVTAPAVFGRVRILPILNEFLAAWPRLRIEASFSDRVTDIVEESFDLAVRIGVQSEGSSFISRTVARQYNAVVASPAYLSTRDVPRRPEDLTGHDCLTYFSGGRRHGWQFQVDGQPVTVRPRGRLTLDAGEALREAALGGTGIAFLPTFLVSDDIDAGRLQSMLDEYASPPDPIVCLYPSRRHLAPKVRRLIDLLASRLS